MAPTLVYLSTYSASVCPALFGPKGYDTQQNSRNSYLHDIWIVLEGLNQRLANLVHRPNEPALLFVNKALLGNSHICSFMYSLSYFYTAVSELNNSDKNPKIFTIWLFQEVCKFLQQIIKYKCAIEYLEVTALRKTHKAG